MHVMGGVRWGDASGWVPPSHSARNDSVPRSWCCVGFVLGLPSSQVSNSALAFGSGVSVGARSGGSCPGFSIWPSDWPSADLVFVACRSVFEIWEILILS